MQWHFLDMLRTEIGTAYRYTISEACGLGQGLSYGSSGKAGD